MTSELFSEIYNKALDILSRREHSVLELKQKLQKKFDTEYDIKKTISRLKKNNLLNDYRFSCLLYTSPSPRDMRRSRMPSSA